MIKEFEGFLTPEEADEVIREGDPKLAKAGVLGKNSPQDYRTADAAWLSNDLSITKKIREKLVEITGESAEQMEYPNFVRYEVGGQYKTHHDFFHPNTDYYEGCVQRGGQRKKTALIYLNEDFKGGETDFPKVKVRVTPKKGKLVVWDNLKENGDLLYESLHAGLPVLEGVKYIAVVWIRERSFS